MSFSLGQKEAVIVMRFTTVLYQWGDACPEGGGGEHTRQRKGGKQGKERDLQLTFNKFTQIFVFLYFCES